MMIHQKNNYFDKIKNYEKTLCKLISEMDIEYNSKYNIFDENY